MNPVEELIKALNEKRNIFLTGAGGTGKSFLLKGLMNKYPNQFVVTSSTGISASLLMEGAMTIHSFSGIGVESFSEQHYNNERLWQEKIMFTYIGLRDKKKEAIRKCKRLIIDEISMISKGQLDLIDQIFRQVKAEDYRNFVEISVAFGGKDREDFDVSQNPELLPFGGIQVIITGDYLQLPPINKEDNLVDGIFVRRKEEPLPEYAFESKVWKEANFKTIYLKEIKRTENKEFAEFLHKLRIGNWTTDDFFYLKKFSKNTHSHPPVKIYADNRSVDKYNNEQLALVDKPLITLKAKWRGDSYELRELKKGILAPDTLELKEGCRVMILVNKPEEDSLNDVDYVNGSTGVFLGVTQKETKRPVWIKEKDPFTGEMRKYKDKRVYTVVEVQLDNGNIVELKRKSWNNGNEIYDKELDAVVYEVEFQQYPIKLAYAVTTHKCVSIDTLLSLEDGLIDFNELIELKKIQIRNGEELEINLIIDGMNKSKKATKIYYKRNSDILKIKSSRGYEIKCSPIHKLKTVNNLGDIVWKKSSELKKGDKILLKKKTNIINENIFLFTPDRIMDKNKNQLKLNGDFTLDYDFAWFIGVITGDAFVNDKKDYSIQLSNPCEDLLEKYEKFIKNRFGITTRNYRYKNKCPRIDIYNKDLRMILLEIGLDFVTAKDKRVPKYIRMSNIEVHKGFIQGLIETDGGINKGGIHITSISKRLLQDVQIMLLNMGIVSSLKKMKLTNSNDYFSYRILISGEDSRILMNTIKIEEKTRVENWYKFKHDKRESKTIKSNVSFIPNGRNLCIQLIKDLKSLNIKGGNLPYLVKKDDYKNIQAYLNRVAIGESNLTTYMIDKIEEYLPFNNLNAWKSIAKFKDFYIDEIVTISKSNSDVYDIYVPEGHDYIANGFINHNSQGATFDFLEIDTEKFRSANQFYVALSRATDPNKIKILNLKTTHIKTCPKALEFYKKLDEEMTIKSENI